MSFNRILITRFGCGDFQELMLPVRRHNNGHRNGTERTRSRRVLKSFLEVRVQPENAGNSIARNSFTCSWSDTNYRTRYSSFLSALLNRVEQEVWVFSWGLNKVLFRPLTLPVRRTLIRVNHCTAKRDHGRWRDIFNEWCIYQV